MLGVVPQELVFDPFFTVRETLRIQSGYFGLRDNDAWIDEVMQHLDLTAQGRRQHARALRRHEAPRAGRAGAGAQAAGDRARRADRRRRRRAAPGAVAVRPPAQPRRPHHRAHHALPRGGGAALQPHRDAQGRAHRRARHDANLLARFPPARCASTGARCRGAGATVTPSTGCHARAGGLRRARAASSRGCARRASRSTSWSSSRPTSSRCSCGSTRDERRR